MTWQIKYTPQLGNQKEACLTIQKHKKNYKLRGWYGPLAELIFKVVQKYLPANHEQHKQQYAIEKQLAQFILIQASFLHQKCLHDYQVLSDTDKAGLCKHHDLTDLLLFIRMTANHPCFDSVMAFGQTQIPWCDDIETQLDQLLEQKLIQQVKYRQWHFYDKNPYPHDHILDLKNQRLFDHHQHNQLEKHQKLIVANRI